MVLDEDMWPRLANELRGRGKQAIALKNTELAGSDDPDLIATIGSWTDTILLTRDDNMPSEHEGPIASVQLTIALWRRAPAMSSPSSRGSERLCIDGFT